MEFVPSECSPTPRNPTLAFRSFRVSIPLAPRPNGDLEERISIRLLVVAGLVYGDPDQANERCPVLVGLAGPGPVMAAPIFRECRSLYLPQKFSPKTRRGRHRLQPNRASPAPERSVGSPRRIVTALLRVTVSAC
jgi:hypothetical protein